MEDEIGKVVTLSDGTRAVVEESEHMLQCTWCALWLTADCEGRKCVNSERADGKNILYRELR